MTKPASALLATFLATGVAHAAVQSADALPPTHTRGHVAWVSGGIGESQAKAFEHGKALLSATSRGPFMLLKLPDR
jgi:hypothetical protein